MLAMAVRNTAKLVREKSKSDNIRLGRLFTKKNTAALMADMPVLDASKSSYTILVPGAGTGILAAALIDRICRENPACKNIFLTCYENDPVFLPVLEDNLERMRKRCKHDYDVRLYSTVYDENYLTNVSRHYTVTYFGTVEDKFDIIIINPPTYMVEKGSDEAEGAGGISMVKISAAYLFAKVAAAHLEENGQLVTVLPTAVASASSLTAFRREMAERLSVRKIHLFVGNGKNHKRAVPLKKNLVLCYQNSKEHADVLITTSADDGSKDKTVALPELSYDFVVDKADGSLTLPKSIQETKIVKYISGFPETLASIGLKMSTGLVIDTKCAALLSDKQENGSIPIIRSGAMKNGIVKFPADGVKKQYLMPLETSLFQRNKNLVIIKRIPAKSDERFLNCALYFAASRPANQFISTHNKVNFIDTRDKNDEICARLAFGLYALLNSTIYDRYLSIVSKSGQVNSKEMKALPLPPKNLIENMGVRLMAGEDLSVASCDAIVNPTLHIIEK